MAEPAEPLVWELLSHHYLIGDGQALQETSYDIARSHNPQTIRRAKPIGKVAMYYGPLHRKQPGLDEVQIKRFNIISPHEYEIAKKIFQKIPDLPLPEEMVFKMQPIRHISFNPTGYHGTLGLDELLERLKQESLLRDADGYQRFELATSLGKIVRGDRSRR